NTGDISVNMRARSEDRRDQKEYRLSNGSGNYFGDNFWVIIVVDSNSQSSQPSSSCSDSASFSSDVTVPDYSHFSAGQSFTKTWRLRNGSGSCTWGSGYTVRFTGGSDLGASCSYSVPSTSGGNTGDISVNMRA